MKEVSKMLPAPLIRSTGNNTVPTQQWISQLAAAQTFWGNQLGKHHPATRMKKKLPLKARYNQHLQPAT